MDLLLESGKVLDTTEIPAGFDPAFCSVCGCRVGWYDTGFGDEAPVMRCDDCADAERSDA